MPHGRAVGWQRARFAWDGWWDRLPACQPRNKDPRTSRRANRGSAFPTSSTRSAPARRRDRGRRRRPRFFTERIAKAVGESGRVFAVDRRCERPAPAPDRIRSSGLTNVETVQGAADDPKLPTGTLDGALIVNAYHEMVDYQPMLTHIRAALKPTGRLVIVEPTSESTRENTRESQTKQHQIAARFVQEEAVAAGFRVVSLDEPFAQRPSRDYEYMLVLSPGGPAPLPVPVSPYEIVVE